MIEKIGDIWQTSCEVIAITTNGVVKKNRELVMGKGIAGDAKWKYPSLPRIWGNYVSTYGNGVYSYETSSGVILFSLPTKHHWRDKSDIKLIVKSIKQLIVKTEDFNHIAIPRPGCSNGGLNWEIDVKPVIEPLLNDRFIIYSLE